MEYLENHSKKELPTINISKATPLEVTIAENSKGLIKYSERAFLMQLGLLTAIASIALYIPFQWSAAWIPLPLALAAHFARSFSKKRLIIRLGLSRLLRKAFRKMNIKATRKEIREIIKHLTTSEDSMNFKEYVIDKREGRIFITSEGRGSEVSMKKAFNSALTMMNGGALSKDIVLENLLTDKDILPIDKLLYKKEFLKDLIETGSIESNISRKITSDYLFDRFDDDDDDLSDEIDYNSSAREFSNKVRGELMEEFSNWSDLKSAS